jgi:ABC-type sugar transport system ATPase subunit
VLPGPSGSGKSTLLRILAGLLQPTSGQVLFKGVPQHGANPHLAIVFQSFALFPWLTVLQNVELGLQAQDLTRTQRLKSALAAIDLIGLDGFEGLKKLLHLIDHQEIDLVLIEYPDRLVRFGYGYLQETFRWKQVRMEVVEPPKVQTPTEELVADLLSIVTVFSGRSYGSRAKNIRLCVSHARKRLFESRSS